MNKSLKGPTQVEKRFRLGQALSDVLCEQRSRAESAHFASRLVRRDIELPEVLRGGVDVVDPMVMMLASPVQ